ncbi:callose synthase 10-like [Rhododendron vialii]|uniref:callose synthase 10-like n=1 Tax=Rhododendron vialii TaxID=182163 RepID=UPI00265FD0A5|nr:callose synthase 10-like [Rhododendron vialii]
MVRPSKNWEWVVRATLRREKLRHDGRGGHERAPIGIASSVPPSLTRETNIDLILLAADEIQFEDPNVARIRKGLVSLKILQLCHPKRLGFFAFVSRRPSPLDTTQLWTSWVTMNAFESILSPPSYTFTVFFVVM